MSMRASSAPSSIAGSDWRRESSLSGGVNKMSAPPLRIFSEHSGSASKLTIGAVSAGPCPHLAMSIGKLEKRRKRWLSLRGPSKLLREVESIPIAQYASRLSARLTYSSAISNWVLDVSKEH